MDLYRLFPDESVGTITPLSMSSPSSRRLSISGTVDG